MIPDVKKETLKAVVTGAEPGSIVSTDELASYGLLSGDGYKHAQIKHGAHDYAHYDNRPGEFIHTNTIESFWQLFKNSIRSTHIHVSPQHMQKYLDESTFRSNHHAMKNAMFDLLIGAV